MKLGGSLKYPLPEHGGSARVVLSVLICVNIIFLFPWTNDTLQSQLRRN